jgi:hypothetical protein
MAAQYGQLGLIDKLLAKGADIDAKNPDVLDRCPLLTLAPSSSPPLSVSVDYLAVRRMRTGLATSFSTACNPLP